MGTNIDEMLVTNAMVAHTYDAIVSSQKGGVGQDEKSTFYPFFTRRTCLRMISNQNGDNLLPREFNMASREYTDLRQFQI